jgi:hypothetical protein
MSKMMENLEGRDLFSVSISVTVDPAPPSPIPVPYPNVSVSVDAKVSPKEIVITKTIDKTSTPIFQ